MKAQSYSMRTRTISLPSSKPWSKPQKLFVSFVYELPERTIKLVCVGTSPIAFTRRSSMCCICIHQDEFCWNFVTEIPPVSISVDCAFFYEFKCYQGGESGSSFLCIMTSLASSGIIFYATEVMVYATADYACWNGSELALVCISSEEESILYSVWCIRRRCIFLWHDCRGCQSLFYMAQGNRNTMVSAFLFGHFIAFFI